MDMLISRNQQSFIVLKSAYLLCTKGKRRRRQWHPTPVLLPGKSHGWRSLGGCSPWGRWGSDTIERLHFHFSLSCIGEGNGSPLQCSYLENPRDRGAWWAAISGISAIAQSQTRLKRLSSIVIVQLLSCVQLFVTPMDCSKPGLLVPHILPEFAQVRAQEHSINV